MKLISLNVWGGNRRDQLRNFLLRQKDKTDIFCLQEVFRGGTASDDNPMQIKNIHPGLHEEIREILKDHEGRFVPLYNSEYGLAVFVCNKIEVKAEGNVALYKNDRYPEAENP